MLSPLPSELGLWLLQSFCDCIWCDRQLEIASKRSTSRSDKIFQMKIGDFIQLLNLSSVRSRFLCSSLPDLQAEHLLIEGVPVTVNVAHMQVSYHSSAFSVISRQIVPWLCVRPGLFQEQPILCLFLSVSFWFLFFFMSSQWVPVTNCNVSEVFIF